MVINHKLAMMYCCHCCWFPRNTSTTIPNWRFTTLLFNLKPYLGWWSPVAHIVDILGMAWNHKSVIWGGWMVLWSYAKKARAIDDPRKRPLFRSFSGNSKTTYSISKRIRQRVFIIEEGVWLHVSGACHGMTICSMVFLTYSMLLYCLYLTNVQCMNDHAWQYLNWHLPILHQNCFGFANHVVQSIFIYLIIVVKHDG